MYSSVSKLDRDVARAFLNAPSNSLSYAPMTMKSERSQRILEPSPIVDNEESVFDDLLPPPHSNARFGRPTHQNLIPMYYDVIIDTISDYDIFYPIAKQAEKYYHDSNSDRSATDPDNYICPRYEVQRLDELAVSMDFPHDFDRSMNRRNHFMQKQASQRECVRPARRTRFPDYPPDILPSNKYTDHSSPALDPYYFHPEAVSHAGHEQPPVRYLTTPFFWFRPVLNDNYAICIPTSRASLHAYVTPLFELHSSPNPVRL